MTDAEMHEKLEVELTVLAMDHQVRVIANVPEQKAFALVGPNCIMLAQGFAALPELQEFCLN
jgi:hypothetical protein